MDFELTKEQRDIKKAARDFAEAEFDKDYILQCELGHKFPWELWKKASERCPRSFKAPPFPLSCSTRTMSFPTGIGLWSA